MGSIAKLYHKDATGTAKNPSPKDKVCSPDLADEFKAELTRHFGQYAPVTLQQEVHDAVAALMSLQRTKNIEEMESLAVSALQAI